jgi:lysophospholipase L1-like esterase
MTARLQNLALFVASSLICLFVIEVSLRIWGPEVLALGNQYVFYKFDPVLGWTNLPESRGRFSRIEFSFPVEINALGMRDKEVEARRSDEFRVAFQGDSFTWGVGAAYGERFTEVVESLDPSINALNFGVSGFSPIQYLFQLDRVLALKPDFVIVVFCLGNDLTDNVEYNPYNHPKPYGKLSSDGSRLEIGGYPLPEDKEVGTRLLGASSFSRIVGLIEFVRDHIRRKRAEEAAIGKDMVRAIGGQLLYAKAGNLTAQEQEQVAFFYKVNELILKAMRDRLDAAIGPGRFAVLLAPTKFEYGIGLGNPNADPNAIANGVLASLARLSIPAIDGRTVIEPSDFWTVDAHWRPSGQRKIGALVAKFLADTRAAGLSATH